MFVELHLLQNFAPSNLNRDDTGSPKDCEFGGYRRARISSQCLKRAIRTAFRMHDMIPAEFLAIRTKRLADRLVELLTAEGRRADEAARLVEVALGGMGLKVDQGKTQYLLFLGESELLAIAKLCNQHWDALTAVAETPPQSGSQASAKQAKKNAKEAVPAEVRQALERVLDGSRAADLALFGRMLADLPDKNVDAAAQVAHAISTNKVTMEFDFYTAVDDIKPEETAGADMLGTVEFNSACFYRYANVDLAQLRKNLGGDDELARQTLKAFLQASITAVPTGKQNSMAAQNPPSLVFAVVRNAGLWSLANAFVRPVTANGHGDLVENSIRALDEYWRRLVAMYGDQGITRKLVATLHPECLSALKPDFVATCDGLVQGVIEAASFTAPYGGMGA